MNFDLIIRPEDNPEKESMTLKFQGKNMETVGTCLFFADSESINKDSVEGESKTVEKNIQNDKDENKDVEMSDHNRVQSSLEIKSYSDTKNGESDIVDDISKPKLIFIGKCKKVVQAFIED